MITIGYGNCILRITISAARESRSKILCQTWTTAKSYLFLAVAAKLPSSAGMVPSRRYCLQCFFCPGVANLLNRSVRPTTLYRILRVTDLLYPHSQSFFTSYLCTCIEMTVSKDKPFPNKCYFFSKKKKLGRHSTSLKRKSCSNILFFCSKK